MVTSIGIGPLGNISANAQLDVRLPANLNGLSWQGQISLAFTSVSSGIYDQRSNWTPLQNLPTGSFQRIAITIPAGLTTALASSNASDLRIGIVLELVNNTQAAYLDRLSFPLAGGSGGAGGSGTGGSGTGGSTVCSPADCADGNPCTLDTCNSGTCTHIALAAGTACSDGNACNGPETCNATGACLAGTPPVIDDGNPCTTDSCAPATGVQHVPLATGTSCSDGNACNGTESCGAGGVCQPGTSPVTDDGNPCTADSCSPATGVSHSPVAAGVACGDGNVCNGVEVCDGSGACIGGVPLVIDDGNACTVDSCDPTTGVTHLLVPAGTPCADTNACNGTESCDGAGACLAGTAPILDDGNPCTSDICDPAVGVEHVVAAAGTSCSDGNACNGAEICSSSGVCTAGTAPVVDDGNSCTTDSCSPTVGAKHIPIASGSPCAGGGICSASGVCQGGSTPTEVISVAFTLPATVEARRVGIGVTSDVYLADRSRLESLSRTWMPMAVNTGHQRTELGANSSSGSVIAFDHVDLRKDCSVNGDVTSGGTVDQQDGAYVAGVAVQNSADASVKNTAKFGWNVTLPATSLEPVMLEPGETRYLSGGAYGDIFVKEGATLDIASSRLYRFNNLMVSPGAILKVADGLPTEIYVNNSATFRGSVVTPTASTPPVMTLVILGSGQMSFETKIRALMIAPKGKVVLGGVDRDFYGAIFADSAELQPDVVLHHIEMSLPSLTPGDSSPGSGGGAELPQLPRPLVSPTALCGPRDQLAFSAWPVSGFCPAQLGLSPFLGTQTGETHWSLRLLSPITGEPIIGARGEIHVLSNNRRLTTFASTGQRRWDAAIASLPAASPTAIRGGVIVVPLEDGALQAFSRDGAALWTVSACVGKPTSVNVDDAGGLMVGCSDGSVSRVGNTGTLMWNASVGAPVMYTVTTGKSAIVLAVTDAALVRLDRDTGATVFSSTLSAKPVGSAVLIRDSAYVVTADGTVRAIGVDGSTKWSTNIGTTPTGAPAVDPWGRLIIPTQAGGLVPVSAESGQIRTAISVSAQPLTQVLIASDGMAYVHSAGNQVYGVNTLTGSTVWSHEVDGAVAGIALDEEGHVLATSASGVLKAIGSNPQWNNTSSSGAATGTNAAACLAQSIETGVHDCDPTLGGLGGDRVAPVRVDTGTGTGGGGQSACLAGTSPPAGVTSQGLDGFGYIANTEDGTGELTWWTPSEPVSDECKLRFCESTVDADGRSVEHEISLTHDDIKNAPPAGSSCATVGGSSKCPVDPESEGHSCKSDAECDADQICAVFCDDAACQAPRTSCGKRLACAVGSLPTVPVGSFDENDPNTWPCEELLECADTSKDFGVSGDTELRKTGSLEQLSIPPAAMTARPIKVLPGGYEDYSNTIAANPCASQPAGSASNKQLDSRSGGTGNKSWGLYVEPDISQNYKVQRDEVFGLPDINVEAVGSFAAGAIVWGNDIPVLEARAEAMLKTCGGYLAPSIKVFGQELKDWSGAISGDDSDSAAEPPTPDELLACENAANALRDKLANLRKSLVDARTAWDSYRRNGKVAPQALCTRTKAILGEVDGAGCSVQSAQAWVDRYQQLAGEARSFVDNEYRAALSTVASKLEGSQSFTPLGGGPRESFGSTSYYPIGPVTLTLEIEIVGQLSPTGTLSYSMGNATLGTGDDGPKVRVDVGPGASADASVYVGAGIPGVSVGLEGSVRLLGVSAPLYTEVGLSKTGYLDPRSWGTSGIFDMVSGGPTTLQKPAAQQWSAEWKYGAGVVLETLSGKISLAARVRLLFFSKTFRKKIADWKGITKRYEFVGSVGQPLGGVAGTQLFIPTAPFPSSTGDLSAAFDATPIGIELPLNSLGGTDEPGACSCVPANQVCKMSSDCCNNSTMECRLPDASATEKKCLTKPEPDPIIL